MSFGQVKNRRRADSAQHAVQARGKLKARASTALRVAVVLALTLGALYGGREAYRWALTSPSFALHTVSFHGLNRATEPELLKLSGLALGQNVLRLEPELLAQAMGAHPWVRRVEISRRFPRAVVIDVEEHTPEAMAVLTDLYLLNTHGEPFKKVGPEDAINLPLVSGLGRDEYMKDPKASAERFRRALEVVQAYQDSAASKGERLSEVRIERDGYSLVTGQGQAVRLGEGAVTEKLERLGRVRSELAKRGLAATSIRLDNRARPGWVAVNLERTAAESPAARKSP